ncbi:MAG: DNA repair protein RecO, partial [Planctomycetota bacterium]
MRQPLRGLILPLSFGVPSLTDQAIVLRVWDFSETSQTVALLTQNHGVIRGLAKGARREKSMFSGGFEPTTAGELVAIIKPSVELATLTEWSLAVVHHHLRANLRAQYAALYCVDLVFRLFESADPHPNLYAALERVLESLASHSVDAELTRFLWCLLSEAGYSPRIDTLSSPIPTTVGFNSATAELV